MDAQRNGSQHWKASLSGMYCLSLNGVGIGTGVGLNDWYYNYTATAR